MGTVPFIAGTAYSAGMDSQTANQLPTRCRRFLPALHSPLAERGGPWASAGSVPGAIAKIAQMGTVPFIAGSAYFGGMEMLGATGG